MPTEVTVVAGAPVAMSSAVDRSWGGVADGAEPVRDRGPGTGSGDGQYGCDQRAREGGRDEHVGRGGTDTGRSQRVYPVIHAAEPSAAAYPQVAVMLAGSSPAVGPEKISATPTNPSTARLARPAARLVRTVAAIHTAASSVSASL